MIDATSSPAKRRGRDIAPWVWPLIAVRLTAMLTLLLACLPLYYLLAPLTVHNPIPRRFLRAVAALAGLRIKTLGCLPAKRTFFLANHVSWLDIPALAGATGTAFIAHDGLAEIGPLRWLCELNDTVFIARHDRNRLAEQIGQISTALCDTGALTIFPEGTTSDGTALLPFKSSLLSALEANADHLPIQPVWLDYGTEVAAIAWAGSEPGLDNALRILARWRPIYLTVHFLPPLEAEQRADRKAISRAASQAITSAMGQTAR